MMRILPAASRLATMLLLRLSPSTLSERTVSRIMIPGAIETHGRVYSRLVPSWMIVPQLTFGGWTPTDRKDSADSVRMVVATISGSSTIVLQPGAAGTSPRWAARTTLFR